MKIKTIRCAALALGAILAASISANTVGTQVDNPLPVRMARYYHLHKVAIPVGFETINQGSPIMALGSADYYRAGGPTMPINLSSNIATHAPYSTGLVGRAYTPDQAQTAPSPVHIATPRAITGSDAVTTTPQTGFCGALQPVISSVAETQSRIESACCSLALDGITRTASTFVPSINGLMLMRTIGSTVSNNWSDGTRASVPEPSSLIALGSCIPVFALVARRRRASLA